MTPALDKARRCQQKGKRKRAVALCRRLLARDPDNAEALHLLGVLLHEMGDMNGARDALQKALLPQPDNPLFLHSMGEVETAAGDLESATRLFTAAARNDPQSVEPLVALANVARLADRLQDAERYCSQAAALEPGSVLVLTVRGLIYLGRDRPAEARELLLQAAETADAKHLPNVLIGLSQAFLGCDQLTEAVEAAERAVDLQPTSHYGLNWHAEVLARQRDWQGVITVLEKLLALVPEDAVALYRLAFAHDQLGHISVAVRHLRTLLRSHPTYAPAHLSLGTSLLLSGSLEQALTCYEQAAALDPSNLSARSNILLALHYRKYLDPDEIFEAHRAVGRTIEAGRTARARRPAGSGPDSPKLTLGFVSPDFRRHSVAYLIQPVIEHLDRDAFTVKCFSTEETEDEITDRLRAQADSWHSIANLDDGAAAGHIESAGVDLLFDLAGHTVGNRLGVFARQAAPLQITWLGYPDTTGLQSIQVRLTDAFTDPEGQTEKYHTEELVRLEPCFLCYSRPLDCPQRTERTGDAKRTVTFGCFGALRKMNSVVLDTWAEILERVPDARLLIKNRCLLDPKIRANVLRQFRRHGRGVAKRVELTGYTQSLEEHLDNYRAVDIALDTFPYNGTTTTLEALWMGTPVITLAGALHISRVSGSILKALELDPFTANSRAEYVSAAVALAQDRQQLNSLHTSLRERMEASPLMDAERFCRQLEQTLRSLWARYCG